RHGIFRLMANPDAPVLASDFRAAGEADWRKLVDAILKGAPFERLESRTYDGLTIEPLYPPARAAAGVAGPARGMPLTVLQRVDHSDPAVANAQAREELENGASGLVLVFADSVSANGFGLDGTADAVTRALDGIDLDRGIVLDLNLSPRTRGVVREIAALIKTRRIDAGTVDLRFSLNPIGGFA